MVGVMVRCADMQLLDNDDLITVLGWSTSVQPAVRQSSRAIISPSTFAIANAGFQLRVTSPRPSAERQRVQLTTRQIVYRK